MLDYILAGAMLGTASIFAGAKIYMTRAEIRHEQMLQLQQRQQNDRTALGDFIYPSPEEEKEPQEQSLPKPNPCCRFCGDRYAVYTDRNEFGEVKSQRTLPILKMIEHPKNCSINQPHVHMKCRLCNVEYPVQQ